MACRGNEAASTWLAAGTACGSRHPMQPSGRAASDQCNEREERKREEAMRVEIGRGSAASGNCFLSSIRGFTAQRLWSSGRSSSA